ncbi:uncharacterized protein LOC116779022 isoform X2 [Danaus plexippus]|uniref:uncharacterized protein LOC116779022 isoform X2 n=1 Tax=Danaus plexippus TaxID=13037 RepID=UPI002AB10577|nr:uncharacterized protein LOC116779022 isoform X2 [Danaus plexippus]
MAEGMIIFTLWYIALAYNYYKENFMKDDDNEESSSAQEDDSPMQGPTGQNELDVTVEKPAPVEKRKSVDSELKLAQEDNNDPIMSVFQVNPTEDIKKSIQSIKSDIQAIAEEHPAVEDLAYQIETNTEEVGEFMQEEIPED